ncbi:GNAT family N-acetyltransferase [Staphylococcus argenteus]|uniref:GNAT family N-acetyltransferase n=1 Tax=Staphylococcus argenteus TaxID=985002 RepID=UPI00050898E4|nr:GNAT family N-acetyltransferase [Staphylococcus argenteus]MBE2133148.1 GNAT family N-acetyltransferase [Staphylococcus argenteus]MBE2147021.1 GNAT family N-acetyltransferase [Staphylococcus argenteus]MBE2161712.1 GNAT family N-acetyltransferase [Staphylococcus argenteus]MCG9796892.1 GNAT family N-acetyltransferase [Staphylococcus argenteus]MCG9799561.1 GNAT family N-acetyltransferase [Staphylococcus argenteus]
MVLRKVIIQDLDQIIALENIGFSPEEAATPEALKSRIEQIQDSFIVAEYNGEVIGYINGPVIKERYISDDLFKNVQTNDSVGGYISVLGLVVAPNYQGQGIAGRLLNYFENLAKNQQRQGITLTCRESLISFYEKYGYRNEGVSESCHGGIKWYNLVKDIKIRDDEV